MELIGLREGLYNLLQFTWDQQAMNEFTSGLVAPGPQQGSS